MRCERPLSESLSRWRNLVLLAPRKFLYRRNLQKHLQRERGSARAEQGNDWVVVQAEMWGSGVEQALSVDDRRARV